MGKTDTLKTYRAKRNFTQSPEPEAGGTANPQARAFVVQKHHARQLHYDFRLELDGSLKSWAIPKEPSLNPKIKRMAVQVEDHPLAYATFEGSIPQGHYGAGDVAIWDSGIWAALEDPDEGYRTGKLKFMLHGQKLRGAWALVRMRTQEQKQTAWLLIKEKDEYARDAAQVDSKAGAKTNMPLPDSLAPQLATLVTEPPAADDAWDYELKFDGYRMLTRIKKGQARLFTRNGKDWTDKLPELQAALAELGLQEAWLDGEIIVPDKNGAPDFQALQSAFEDGSSHAVVYYLFDLLFHEGLDLRPLPLRTRRSMLEELLQHTQTSLIQFSSAFEAHPSSLLLSACQLGFEGIIGKRNNAAHRSGRSTDWIKLKCHNRQEFIIGGYTKPQGSRPGLGALLLGVHDDQGRLRYAGKVGTGFDDKTLLSLKKQLDKLSTQSSPFHDAPTHLRCHWVRPTLLAEISFAQWTRDGHIRHGVFRGLRNDKPAKQITRETAVKAEHPPSVEQGTNDFLGSLHITSPERIVDALSGISKMELVRCYAAMASLILPHLEGRPVALVRAPDGVEKELFFQKHAERTTMPGIRQLDPALDPGHAPLLEIHSIEGLLAAVQMNTIEFHTWNANDPKLAKPDRMTFDLDPGEGVNWPQIQEGTRILHLFLQELGLPSFLKTSGGKGLHVVVPLLRRHDWDTVKAFSRAIVQHLSATLPQHFVAKSGPRNRVGKIFIDYLRNGFGATTASAWSVRARPGLGVSVPLAWDELGTVTSSSHWTLKTLGERLSTGNTPWNDYEHSRTNLSAAMKRLGFDPKAASKR